MRRLAQEGGVTVLFSTHILNDIERVCSRVAVLHDGRLIANGDLAALKRSHGVEQMDGSLSLAGQRRRMSFAPLSKGGLRLGAWRALRPFLVQEYLRVMRSRLALLIGSSSATPSSRCRF
jgi:energy-coupling factor transporter ATP-binding protein EcfA2